MASHLPLVSAQVGLRALSLAEMATPSDNKREYGTLKTVQQPTTLRATITTLPTELHFKIFKQLHIVHATCLGLTSRVLYSALKGLYPNNISIDPYAYSYNWAEIGLLGDYLKVWMKPRFLWDGFVFVMPRRYKELEDRDYELNLRAQMEDLCMY